MPKLNTYLINLDVEGLQVSGSDFIAFLEYFKSRAGDLITWEQNPEKSNLFEISVPSDTNLFMLGIIWDQFDSIDKAGIRININDNEDFDDDDFGMR